MRKNIFNIFKEHYLAIALAIVAGIIAVAPQIYFAFFTDAYSGIHIFKTDAETHYLARINEVYNGHPALGNVFLENKNKPYMQPPLGEIIVAGIGKISGLNAPDMNVASKFLFPPLVFILFYVFVYKLFVSKKIAILSASVALFGGNLLSLTSGPRDIIGLMSMSGSAAKFLTYTRPIIPQISTLFLFGSLYFLFQVLNGKSKDTKKWLILAGVSWGLAIYIYIYTWSFLAIFTFLYLFYVLYKKDRNSIISLFWIIVIHSVITLPYWINFIQARLDPAYGETAMRFGLVSGHAPVFSMWLAVSLIAVVFLWPKRYKRAITFFLFMVVSLLIAINQQIITGVVMQQAHYHWYITKPLVVSILASVLFVYLLERFIRSNKVGVAVMSVVVALLFYNGLLVQVSAYKNNYETAVGTQRYSEVFAYLKENYDTPKTIWSRDNNMSNLLAGYTEHNAVNSYAAYYLIERDYFIKRLFLEYRLRGIDPQEIGMILEEEKAQVSESIFAMYYREKFGDSALMPQDFLIELEDGYKSFYNLSFFDVFKGLQIDLVVWDKKNEPDLIYKNIPALREVVDVGDGFIIYEI